MVLMVPKFYNFLTAVLFKKDTLEKQKQLKNIKTN